MQQFRLSGRPRSALVRRRATGFVRSLAAFVMLLAGLASAEAEIVDQKGPDDRIAGAALREPQIRQGEPARGPLEGPSHLMGVRAGRPPVEITAEFDTWRKIRDSEGSEGWVLHSLLSGRRTALVAPWKKDQSMPLYDQPRGGRDGGGQPAVRRDRQRQEVRRPMVPHLRRRLRRLRAAEQFVGVLSGRAGGVIFDHAPDFRDGRGRPSRASRWVVSQRADDIEPHGWNVARHGCRCVRHGVRGVEARDARDRNDLSQPPCLIRAITYLTQCYG